MANIKDREGHNALTPSHLRIIEYIGSFPRRKGCFASDDYINAETINVKSIKTLRRHLQYLIAIRALVVSKEIVDGTERRILRLEFPAEVVVSSQKDFRVAKGMSEYAYVKKQAVIKPEQTEVIMDSKSEKKWDDSWFFEEKKVENQDKKEPVFLGKSEENFAKNEELFAEKEANFAQPSLQTVKDTKKETNELPPKSPLVPELQSPAADSVPGFVSEVCGSLRDPDVPPDRRNSQEGCRLPNSGDFFFSKSNSDDFSEPLTHKKKGKKQTTARERRAEAVQKINAGHIANPIGGPNNRKRECNWKLARDIGNVGAVTTPQLWRHLVKLYDQSFGPGILERMLSKDQSALNSTFAELKSVFSKICNYEADNRVLAEYFDWFFEPKRLGAVLADADRYTNPDKTGVRIIHFKQLCGAVFVQRFFNQVIKLRQLDAKLAPISKADEFALAIDKNYSEFRAAVDDNKQFAKAMIVNGYALAAQFLHEEKDLDESQCKQRIIHAMSDYIKNSQDHRKAVKFLREGIETTEENSYLLRKESCIWFDWKEKTKDLVDIAILQSGVNIDEPGKTTGGTS